MRSPVRLVFTVVVLGLACCEGPIRAADFAGGTGDFYNPYQIKTAEHLLTLSDQWRDFKDKCFILVSDISLTDVQQERFVSIAQKVQWNPRNPNPPEESSFDGFFEGNGYVIRNLTKPLFGVIGELGVVRNLGLEDVNNLMTQRVFLTEIIPCPSLSVAKGSLAL